MPAHNSMVQFFGTAHHITPAGILAVSLDSFTKGINASIAGSAGNKTGSDAVDENGSPCCKRKFQAVAGPRLLPLYNVCFHFYFI